MPTLIYCPHCLYPILVPADSRGPVKRCRQCGGGYQVARSEMMVRRIPGCVGGALNDSPVGSDAAPQAPD